MREIPRKLALDMKEAFEAVSPFIEKHTRMVCPACPEACCIDRHGTHEEEDFAFLRGLGQPPPPEPPRAVDTEPCRHLSETGCRIPRWLRPFRCTWYFCSPLLEEMPEEDPREYREFMRALERLQDLRRRVADAVKSERADAVER